MRAIIMLCLGLWAALLLNPGEVYAQRGLPGQVALGVNGGIADGFSFRDSHGAYRFWGELELTRYNRNHSYWNFAVSCLRKDYRYEGVLGDQLVPMAEDEQFKAELLRQRNIYRQLNQEAHAAIDACGGSAQGQSAMAKLNTKVSIGMKTITDKSTRNLAEMLTQGSGMGVVDCIKSQKDYPDAAPGSKRLMQKLQDFEEDNRLKLEQYL